MSTLHSSNGPSFSRALQRGAACTWKPPAPTTAACTCATASSEPLLCWEGGWCRQLAGSAASCCAQQARCATRLFDCNANSHPARCSPLCRRTPDCRDVGEYRVASGQDSLTFYLMIRPPGAKSPPPSAADLQAAAAEPAGAAAAGGEAAALGKGTAAAGQPAAVSGEGTLLRDEM